MKPDRDYGIDSTEHATLLHAFASRSDCHDIGVTFTDEEGRDHQTSWAELVTRARRRATWLAQRTRIQPGQPVGLALPNDTTFIESLFATWILGALPVTLARPGLFGAGTMERARHIIEDAGLRHILCASADASDFADLDASLTVHTVDGPLDDTTPARAFDLGVITPSSPGVIQYTSGSTSRPRGVALTHHNLAQNCYYMTADYHFEPREALTSWLPFYHDMGLIAELLVTVYRRLPFYLLETMTFLQDPMVWLSSISRHRATISHIPNFALAHCLKRISDDELATLDLSHVHGVFLGSEPIDKRVVDAFTTRFASTGLSPDAIGGAYGLAESTVGVCRTEPMAGLRFDRVDRHALADGLATPADSSTPHTALVANVGRVIREHRVIIVDERGEELGERQVGELLVQGPSVMRGYWEKPGATARVLSERGDGVWLSTGDSGYFVGDELHICGRIKEVIIIRGKNYHPEDLERAAELVDEVRPGQAIAFSVPGKETEQVILVCETTAPASEHPRIQAQVKAMVNEHVGVKVARVDLAPPNTTPKTTSGKRQRRLVRTLWMKMRGDV